MDLINMNWMKSKKWILICIVCISFMLSACSKNNDPIKIGVLGTMSDINSDLSVSGRRGIELATYEFNESGGLN